MLLKTGLNNILLNQYFAKPTEQYFARPEQAEQYMGRTIWAEHYGQQNIVQACFQQYCYRLGVFFLCRLSR
jgi:hypothetical protein